MKDLELMDLRGFCSVCTTSSQHFRSFLIYSDFGLTLFKPKDAVGYSIMVDKELLNGRLAMIAVGGIATQSVISGHGFPYI